MFEVTGSQPKTVSFCVYFTVHFLEMGFLKLWHPIFNVLTLATVMMAFHIGGCIQEVIVRQEANAVIGDQLFILTRKIWCCTQHTMHYDRFVTFATYAYAGSFIVLPNILFFTQSGYVITSVTLQYGKMFVHSPSTIKTAHNLECSL